MLADHSGKYVATGYANPHSLIAFRVITRTHEEIDAGLIRERVAAAKALRERFYPGRKTLRVFYSESDFLPGLIVDRYGDWLSVQSLTAGCERLLPLILDSLREIYRPSGIVLRNDSGLRALEGLPIEKKVAAGEYAGPIEVELPGLRLFVDPMEGQKTGFFLDQVDNYRLLDDIAPEADALDLFCHTGAWALSAAKRGAARCTGVDSSEAALSLAGRNAGINGLEDRVEFVREDVFKAMKRLRADGKRFGVVVSDPPAFVKSRARLAEGVRGYRDLNTRVMELVREGGFLISCSCSYHLDKNAFLDVLRESAAGAGRTLRLIEMRSQSRDHPVLLAAPETEYLKCALLQVL